MERDDATSLIVRTFRNVDGVGHVGDVLQRTLDTVKNGTHDAGSKFDGQRLAGSQHGITDGDGS